MYQLTLSMQFDKNEIVETQNFLHVATQTQTNNYEFEMQHDVRKFLTTLVKLKWDDNSRIRPVTLFVYRYDLGNLKFIWKESTCNTLIYHAKFMKIFFCKIVGFPMGRLICL